MATKANPSKQNKGWGTPGLTSTRLDTKNEKKKDCYEQSKKKMNEWNDSLFCHRHRAWNFGGRTCE